MNTVADAIEMVLDAYTQNPRAKDLLPIVIDDRVRSSTDSPASATPNPISSFARLLRAVKRAEELNECCKHPTAAEPLGPTTATTYDTLKRKFSEEGPALSDAFLKDVFWVLYHDPAPTASLTLGYDSPDVEATFSKGTDGITSTLRVSDYAGSMRTTETRYSLVDGDWQAEVVHNWQR